MKAQLRSAEAVIIDSYRNLVSALLTHTCVDDEGTELAIADFIGADLAGVKILLAIGRAQTVESENVR